MKRNYARAVELMALRHANKDALINIERNRRYTYAQLDRLSNRIANALRTSLELGAGDRIMLILENDNLSIMRLPLMFKHDAVVALTNFRDTAEEHRHQAEYIRPQAVFIEASMVEGYAAFLQGLGGKVIVMDSPSPDQLARFPRADLQVERSTDGAVWPLNTERPRMNERMPAGPAQVEM